jgi:hypothetical protein
MQRLVLTTHAKKGASANRSLERYFNQSVSNHTITCLTIPTMQKQAIIFIFICLFSCSCAFAQSKGQKQTSNEEIYHRKKTTRTTKTIRSKAEMDSIRKVTAPIQNDNGTVNTTGIIDGSRSSTGRPGADTTVNYTVRKRKKVVQTGGVIITDTTKKKK